eukprot:5203901-Prorocentrum_lima.AAC.1
MLPCVALGGHVTALPADKYATQGAPEHPFAEATATAIQQARSTVVAVARYIGDLTCAYHQHYGALLQ